MPRPAALPRLLLLVLPAALDAAAGGSDPMGGGERCCGVAPVDPMRRIFSWSGPGPPLTAPLAAARGELVHLQAVVALPPASVGSAAPGAVTTMTASAASLGAPVTVRRVGYLNLTRTFSAERPTGLYPALLLPPSYMYANATDSTRPAAGTPTVFWLSMSIPRGAAPGLHRGVINATVAAATRPGSSSGSTTCTCSAAFMVEVSRWSIPAAPTQLTGAMFESKYVAEFSPRQVYSPETALNFFASFAAQRVNSFAWFELDGPNTPSQAERPRLPWAPTYRWRLSAEEEEEEEEEEEAGTDKMNKNNGRSSDARQLSSNSSNANHSMGVILNTTMHQIWWPRVLNLTGAKHWRMPFSTRVFKYHHGASSLPTNSTWNFSTTSSSESSGSAGLTGTLTVPIFGARAGELNPEFTARFKALFSEVLVYLEANGWDNEGCWVQVQDEPSWGDAETLANIVAIMRLCASAQPTNRPTCLPACLPY
jgi:hypothetical protein